MASMAMPLEQVLHMKGGAGETSFSKNALLPKVMMRVRPILEEIINKMYCTILPTCVKVADLGCSSGPNALLVASNIMDIVDETNRRLKAATPTTKKTMSFQFFLNDLFGNDFNSIFKSLPEFYRTVLKQDDAEKHAPTCFVNATPGSFYGSLFPPNSIHFFHSSFSLQWLSQAPKWTTEEAILPGDEKGNIYVTSINPPSYAEQFKKDFKLFLRSRSMELVPGGGMLLTIFGRYDTSENITTPGLIRMILNDMVSEDLIQKERLDSFNVPIYTATAGEVREVIREEGSFGVERLESFRTSWDGSSRDEEGSESFKFVDDNERGEFVARSSRAVMEPLLKAHFGEGIMDELFIRYKNKVIQLLPKLEFPILVISLIKIA